MENVYVLNGLKAKRAELDGEVRAAEKRIVQLRADLGAIDHTIRIFDPAAVPSALKPKVPRAPSVGFERGDFSRAVLDALREAQAPLTARDIASRIIVARGLDVEGSAAMQLLIGRVRSALDRRHQGVHGEKRGDTVLWRVE